MEIVDPHKVKRNRDYGKQISEFIIESLVLEMLSEKTMRRLVRSKARPKVVYNDLLNINEYLDKLYSFIKHD